MPSFFRLICLSTFALFSTLIVTAPGVAATLDRVAAVVNGKMITQFEVDERTREYSENILGKRIDPKDPKYPDIAKQVLNTMIDDILLMQEAERFKITITDVEAEAQIRQVKEQARLTEAQFLAELKKEGMTRKSYIDQLKKDLLKRRVLAYMVQRKVVVTDDEMQAYLKDGGADASAGSFSKSKLAAAPAPAPANVGVGQVRLGLIMLAKPEQAKQLKAEIETGKISFADAARRHSVGPAKESGGDLGVLSVRDLAPDVAKAVATLSPGKVSEPVLMNGKTVLVTLLDASTATAPAQGDPSAMGPGADIADKSKREAFEQLYRPKAEKLYRDYLDKLRAKSVVEIKM